MELTKEEARTLGKEQRSELDDFMVKTMSEQILVNAASIIPPGATVHVFLPITHHKEVDTMPFIEQHRRGDQFRLVSSRSNFADFSMVHLLLSADTTFEKNPYGIPEPVSGAEVAPEVMDVVMVPLLTADKQGYRVGYGKGFYDRFLKDCRPDCRRIGLSYASPIDRIIDVDEHDVPVTHLATPERIVEICQD